MRILVKLTTKTICSAVAAVLFLSFMAQGSAQSQTITFRIVALNPSKIKTQNVPVRVELPIEVKPKNVLDLGGLSLDFDPTRSLFYLYKDSVHLKPAQTRIFTVEMEDVWFIAKEELDNIKERTSSLLGLFANTQYSERMERLAGDADSLISEVISTQEDESVSRSRHIGAYRINTTVIAKLKEEIEEMERILKEETGPLTPDVFAKTGFKTKAPTKTATWLIIFAVIIFIGLMSLVFFFTWYSQSKVTHKVISEAKKDSFGEE